MLQDKNSRPSPCEVEALKKCLEENSGDGSKCTELIEAFSKSCTNPKRSLTK
jgi:hypothetical protein